jgi:hypothetical protein
MLDIIGKLLRLKAQHEGSEGLMQGFLDILHAVLPTCNRLPEKWKGVKATVGDWVVRTHITSTSIAYGKHRHTHTHACTHTDTHTHTHTHTQNACVRYSPLSSIFPPPLDTGQVRQGPRLCKRLL